MKKGATPVYGLEYIVRIILVVLVLAGLVSIISLYLNIRLDSKGIENTILIKRIMYEPGLLIYKENITGRYHPGIIDDDNFDPQRFADIFRFNKNNVAAIIELKNLRTNDIKIIYVNEQKAKAWQDIVVIGDFDTSISKRYVRIHNNGVFEPGLLKVQAFTKG